MYCLCPLLEEKVETQSQNKSVALHGNPLFLRAKVANTIERNKTKNLNTPLRLLALSNNRDS
jgi:hypothetical protein